MCQCYRDDKMVASCQNDYFTLCVTVKLHDLFNHFIVHRPFWACKVSRMKPQIVALSQLFHCNDTSKGVFGKINKDYTDVGYEGMRLMGTGLSSSLTVIKVVLVIWSVCSPEVYQFMDLMTQFLSWNLFTAVPFLSLLCHSCQPA